ncbi:MAG: hypothetical protein LBT20_08875, partial [Clostridiales bacterium]|nr:hypothetical protein [Clostridiales bacterium]
VSANIGVLRVASNGTVTIIGAGTVAVTVTKAEDGDYAAKLGTLDITVSPKAIMVTADNKQKIAGAADPKLTYTVHGLLKGDALIGSLKYTGNAAGSYDIVEDVPFSNSNYTITFVKGTITITEAEKPIVTPWMWFGGVLLVLILGGGLVTMVKRSKMRNSRY